MYAMYKKQTYENINLSHSLERRYVDTPSGRKLIFETKVCPGLLLMKC